MKLILGSVVQNTDRNAWLIGYKYWSKYLLIIANFNEIGCNEYNLLRPIAHSNFEVRKLNMGLVLQNTFWNAWLLGLKYCSKYW